MISYLTELRAFNFHKWMFLLCDSDYSPDLSVKLHFNNNIIIALVHSESGSMDIHRNDYILLWYHIFSCKISAWLKWFCCADLNPMRNG